MPLTLQADLGIEQVTDLQATLRSHFEDDVLELSGAEVRRVHTAGLQLLHAFIRDRAVHGRTTTITLPSPVLVEAARQLALADRLGVATAPGDAA